MLLKLLGAVFIIGSCGACGFLIAYNHKREERMLRQLVSILDYMECDLQYHLTPLPELAYKCSQEAGGVLADVFKELAKELEGQISPNATHCMLAVLQKINDIPSMTWNALKELGEHLGKFDLQGQLKGLEACRQHCRSMIEKLMVNQTARLRSYQTLGICAGAALAILFV